MWAEFLGLLGYGLLHPGLWAYQATRAEQSRPLPGDELVPTANSCATYAATLHAPPDEVWPWLLQMGEGRAGWYCWSPVYSYPEFKHRASPWALHPEWQRLKVGDVLLDGDVKGQCNENRGAWRVRDLEPGRAIVFFSARDLIDGFEFDPSGPRPRQLYGVTSWVFYLEPLAAAQSRLLIRTRAELGPGWCGRLLARVVIGGFDAVFERTILDGIKQRVERCGQAADRAKQRATADLGRLPLSV
jgi:proline iminopeptidase